MQEMKDFESALEALASPQREIARRFLTTLGQTADPTLVVLRSHLLLEELLWTGVLAALPHGEHLARQRFGFGRLIPLFKALHGDGGQGRRDTWEFLARLNMLRNDLAHNVDVPKLEASIDALIALLSISVETRIEPSHRRAYLFTLAVAYVGGQLKSALPTAGALECESGIGRAAPRTCFISAPAGAELGVLRTALEARGLSVLVPRDLAVGADWASEIQRELLRADLVVGVLTAERQSPWVLFELGQASALGRRIVLITSPQSEPIPFSLHDFLVLRIDLDNQLAIGFAFDQLLSAPAQVKEERIAQSKSLVALGPKVDRLIISLEQLLRRRDWRPVQDALADALRAAGADIVVTSPARDTGPDLAVWSDVLEPFVGNPILVEVKRRIQGRDGARRAVRQLASYIEASGSRWAILLYADGPSPEADEWAGTPPNILVLPLRSFLEALRTRAFPEVVRDLRNRRVHGSSS